MVQDDGVEGCEGRRGSDPGDDEFGDMESPTGAGEGQGLSPPVVRALDTSLHPAQFTPEQSVVITVKVQIGGSVAQIELREVEDKRRL